MQGFIQDKAMMVGGSTIEMGWSCTDARFRIKSCHTPDLTSCARTAQRTTAHSMCDFVSARIKFQLLLDPLRLSSIPLIQKAFPAAEAQQNAFCA